MMRAEERAEAFVNDSQGIMVSPRETMIFFLRNQAERLLST